MTRIAIIGCGKIANAHVNALTSITDAEITAVCDVSEAKRNEFAERTGANAYASYEEMLNSEEIGLAIICLPPAFHRECTEFCASKGVNVFVEKPMAVSSEDCLAMIEACKENDVMLWVGHMQRYSPENRIAKELIDSGEYGKLLAISEVRTCAYPGPASPKWLMTRDISGGGILFNFGAHTLDMIKYLSDSEIEKAECNISFSKWDSENGASGFLKLRSGASATFNLIGNCSVNRYEIVVYLSEGEIRINPRSRITACGRDGIFSEIATDKNQSWQYLQLRDVIDSLEMKNAKVDGEYGLEIIKGIEKLYASAGRK